MSIPIFQVLLIRNERKFLSLKYMLKLLMLDVLSFRAAFQKTPINFIFCDEISNLHYTGTAYSENIPRV